MKLYVMRHAHSPSILEARVVHDADRPLSERGLKQARSQAGKLKAQGARPSLILHSPLKRAAQTAQEASAVLGLPAKAFAPLSNELAAPELAAALAEPLAEAGELLIVGHQPQVGELAAWLCGGVLEFLPAGLVALELSKAPAARGARLLWSAGADA